jgi:hypothetical protein
MRSQRLVCADTGTARPEAPEAKEPCQRSVPACGPQRSDEGAERGSAMQAGALLRSLRSDRVSEPGTRSCRRGRRETLLPADRRQYCGTLALLEETLANPTNMRIYLDSNVIQDLKKPENKELYEWILADSQRNYYYFSEAHIQDLVQDDTDNKLADMDFMETIVGSNCWHYAEKMHLNFRTPRAYYNEYSWNEGTQLLTSEDAVYQLLRETLRAMPIDFKAVMKDQPWPTDCPEGLKAILLKPTTMLEFTEAMLNMTEEISAKRSPEFKELLRYLHLASGLQVYYETLGILGFDGQVITDDESFAHSFKDFVYQRSQQKDLYNQFIDGQYALEVYGIVKGKPKKQKFMSLLNDGKHAFYAAHGHVMVTSDGDMTSKTGLLYKVWGIATEIIGMKDLLRYCEGKRPTDGSVTALVGLVDQASELPTCFENFSLEQVFVQKQLPGWFLEQFNTLTCASNRGYIYYYLSQEFANLPTHTTTVELERVVEQLATHFGLDELGRGNLDRTELDGGDWKGREWRFGEMGVLLQLKKGMMLSIFKAASPVD